MWWEKAAIELLLRAAVQLPLQCLDRLRVDTSAVAGGRSLLRLRRGLRGRGGAGGTRPGGRGLHRPGRRRSGGRRVRLLLLAVRQLPDADRAQVLVPPVGLPGVLDRAADAVQRVGEELSDERADREVLVPRVEGDGLDAAVAVVLDNEQLAVLDPEGLRLRLPRLADHLPGTVLAVPSRVHDGELDAQQLGVLLPDVVEPHLHTLEGVAGRLAADRLGAAATSAEEEPRAQGQHLADGVEVLTGGEGRARLGLNHEIEIARHVALLLPNQGVSHTHCLVLERTSCSRRYFCPKRDAHRLS